MTNPQQTTRKLENQAQHLNYYPHWLDNLADDVILQGAVFNGELRGAQQVGRMLSFARSLYAFQDFRFYGMRGDLFLEDYRSRIRGTEAYHPSGVEIYNFVVVYFNDAGETSQLVMNHRPQSAALLFSSLLAKHFGDAFDPSLFYGGDVSAHLLNRDLSRGLWPGSSSGPAGASESHSR
ncbi:MAG TPA: hypothetical protein VN866_14785 [Mycobacterium sp.]|nr:hypothetical protein [Mycobacterium sp.]